MPTPTPYEFADALEPELKRLYLKLVAEARGRIPMAELQAAISARNQAEVIRIVEVAAGAANPKTVAAWRAAIEEIFGKTAQAAASRISSVFAFSFNLFDPGVLDEIDRIVAEQVKVGGDTQLAIREVVRRGWVEGITPYNQGRIIRAMVGPTPGHSIAAYRYLGEMFAPGSDVPEDTAIRNYELYENRLLNWRAETISRTENIRAANAGRIATWRQMIADGFLEEDRMWLKWHVTDDDVVCPYCAPMDGQEIRFGGMFRSTEKGYPGEPGRKQPRYDSLRPDPYGLQRDKEGKFISSVVKAVVPRGGKTPVVEVPYPPLHPSGRCDVRLILK